MKINVTLIRHGRTEGNLSGRYVGRTDEDLCETGIRELTEHMEENQVALVFSSPMRRCLQTAAILYPTAKVVVVNDLRECDFGRFEYMNYSELNGEPDYQVWIDSGGVIGFPEGEPLFDFKKREIKAFEEIAEKFCDIESQLCETADHRFTSEGLTEAAIVCHGGSIMAIMEHFAEPRQDYFCWQVKNGRGFRCIFDTEKWKNGARCLEVVDK